MLYSVSVMLDIVKIVFNTEGSDERGVCVLVRRPALVQG